MGSTKTTCPLDIFDIQLKVQIQTNTWVCTEYGVDAVTWVERRRWLAWASGWTGGSSAPPWRQNPATQLPAYSQAHRLHISSVAKRVNTNLNKKLDVRGSLSIMVGDCYYFHEEVYSYLISFCFEQYTFVKSFFSVTDSSYLHPDHSNQVEIHVQPSNHLVWKVRTIEKIVKNTGLLDLLPTPAPSPRRSANIAQMTINRPISYFSLCGRYRICLH